MKNYNINNTTREKILKTAAQLFSENGFDGTRVDEIAEKAGVNKALIYYYFESKVKILEVLLEENITDYIAAKKMLAKSIHSLDYKNIEEYADKSMAALKEKSEIIRIAVIEAMKNNKNDVSLFKIIDISYNSMIPKIKEMGLHLESETESLIAGFFFCFAPIAFSIILGEKWAEYHNIDRNEFHSIFSKRIKDFFLEFTNEFLADGE